MQPAEHLASRADTDARRPAAVTSLDVESWLASLHYGTYARAMAEEVRAAASRTPHAHTRARACVLRPARHVAPVLHAVGDTWRALAHAQGYDCIDTLRSLDRHEWAEMTDVVGVKRGHALRMRRSLRASADADAGAETAGVDADGVTAA